MRPTAPAALVPLALLLAACGTPADPSTSTLTSTATVVCGGSTYDAAALPGAPPAEALPPDPNGPAGAVDDAGAPAFDPALGWRVVRQEDDRVDLVRELERPVDDGEGDVRTHEARTLQHLTGASQVPDGTWLLMSAGPCAQRLLPETGLGPATVTLASTPSPGATSLDLLVREIGCASGRDAEGRIEVVDLEQTAQQVRLRLAVAELTGDQSCPGNPATPLTVQLTAPLGDREVVDASVLPARPLVQGESDEPRP